MSSTPLQNLKGEAAAVGAASTKSLTSLADEARFFMRVLISSADRFYWDNGFSKAASLAYTTLLSVVPAMALAFGMFASFAVSSEHVADVRRFIFKQFVPNTAAVDSALGYLAKFSDSISSLNAIVILFLIITSILLLNSVEYALNEMWQVYEPRSIPHRLAIFCAILVIAPALAISGYYFATLRVQPLLNTFGGEYYTGWIYNYVLSFLIDFLAFVSLFYLVPKAPVRLNSACGGALVSAVLFAIAKEGYAYYIEKLSSYGTVYTTLAAIPISLFWLYIGWTVVLYGVEVSYQAQYLPRQGKIWKRTVLNAGDGQLLLATQALVLIGRAFSRGDPMPNDLELAERLGCSSVVIKPALDSLEKAGILCRGDSRDTPLTLMRDPAKVTVGDIRKALFGTRSAVHFAAELQRLFAAFRAGQEHPNLTLEEILRSE